MTLFKILFLVVLALAPLSALAEEAAAPPIDELWEDVTVEAVDAVAGAEGQVILKGKNETTGYASDYVVNADTDVSDATGRLAATDLKAGEKVHVVYEYDSDYHRVGKQVKKL